MDVNINRIPIPRILYNVTEPPAANHFSVLQLNAQSLRNKLHLLEAELVRFDKPEIVLVGETWMKQNEQRNYDIDGYLSYHLIRADGYGGLSLYVRNDVMHEAPENIMNSDGLQMLKMRISRPRFTFLGVYRAPSSPIALFMTKLEETLSEDRDTILCGDTNINLLSDSYLASNYLDLLNANGFYVLNELHERSATLRRGSGISETATVIDHFAANLSDRNFAVSVNPSIGDHNSVFMTFDSDMNETSDFQRKKTIRQKERVRRELIRFFTRSANSSIEQFHDAIRDIIASGERVVDDTPRKKSLPWIDDEVKLAMKKRDAIYKLSRRAGLSSERKEELSRRLKSQKNYVTSLTRRKKNNFISNMIERSLTNQRQMWKVLKKVFSNSFDGSKQDKLPDSMHKENITASSTQDKVEMLNQHFVDTGKSTRQKLESDYGHRPRKSFTTKRVSRSIYLFPTSTGELNQIIKELKSDAATGMDGIDTRTLKTLSKDLAEAILPMINECLVSGHYPITFKKTLIIPVYKGVGDKRDPNNYRPISIISNLAKIFEKLLYKRIMEFLTKEKFFAPSQFGFLPGSNTTAAVLHAINKIKNGLDSGKHVSALFLDISKAFDCVDHVLLLEKLERAGIRGNAHDLIANYLFGRGLRVKSEGILSGEAFMTTGIPQGSSLSTLLYLIYTNDFYELPLKGYFQTFADDTMAIYEAEATTELQSMIQHDAVILAEWFYSNYLAISPTKTKLMNFSLRSRAFEPQILFNGSLLSSTTTYKYLGFIIDHRLSFSDHIKHIKSKIIPFVAMLKKIKFVIPTCMMLSIYHAYIHSHLVHLISVWGFASNYLIEQLQVLQNRAIRTIFWRDHLQQQLSTELIYKKYKIMNLAQLLKYDSIMTIFKMKTGQLKLNIELTTFETTHSYFTRGRGDFVLPLHRTTTAKKSLFSMGLNWSNKLPPTIKNMQQIVPFKKAVKNAILNDLI